MADKRIKKPYELFYRRSKTKPFGVRTRGDNGEILNVAQGFTTKHKAIVNIRATARVVNPNLTNDEIKHLINVFY